MYAKKGIEKAPSRFDFDLAIKGVSKNDRYSLSQSNLNCSYCVIMVEVDGYDQLQNKPQNVSLNMTLRYFKENDEMNLADVDGDAAATEEGDSSFVKIMIASCVTAVILVILVVIKKRRDNARKNGEVDQEIERSGTSYTRAESNTLL